MSTMMWVFLALAAGCTVSYLTVLGLGVLGARFNKRPHFVHSSVNGILAFCGEADFRKALASLKAREKDPRLVVVRDTLAYSCKPHPLGRGFTGVDYDLPFEFDHTWLFRRDPRLFVPFASAGIWSFAEQAHLFSGVFPMVTPEQREWVQKKKAENIAASRARRFGDWMEKRSKGLWDLECMLLLGAIGFAFAFALAFGVYADAASETRPAAFYSTDTATAVVSETRGTNEELDRLPVRDDQSAISVGEITEVQSLGGDLVAACIRRASDSAPLCGFAPRVVSPVIGQKGYLRLARVRYHPKGPRECGRWFITPAEAKALTDKGYMLDQ